MLLPLFVSLLYGEVYSALSFLAAAGLTMGVGGLVYRVYRNVGEPERRHAMVIAGLGWLVSAMFGSLPFIFAAYWTPAETAQSFVPEGAGYSSSLLYFRNPLHAFFESMSAYTTTGLTMTVHEPSIGKGLLFYRSLAQWVGGVGVVLLSLAIIPRPHMAGELELYRSESAGLKLRPSILGTARAIWKVYIGLTLLIFAYLFVAALILVPQHGVLEDLFNALNHAMTGLATGGFSTLDDSISGYRSYAMEMVHLLPMLLGAISIPLYYRFCRKRDWLVFWRDPQFRSMCILLLCGVPLLVLLLLLTPIVSDPLREGIFQFTSGLSGTGWQTSDFTKWSSPAILLMACGAMVVSGSAGSTVGGIKLIRAYVLYRAAAWRVTRLFLPKDAVVPFRVGERHLSAGSMHEEVAEAAIFSILYVLVLLASVFAVALLVGPGHTLAEVIFESSSAQGTVGLSAGITDPGMSPAVEAVFIFQMWIGRLEIFPVIVLLCAPFAARRSH
jgi:trk system potassium uptake protein TrkH